AARRRGAQQGDPRPHPGRPLGRAGGPGRHGGVPGQPRLGLRQRRGDPSRRRLAGALKPVRTAAAVRLRPGFGRDLAAVVWAPPGERRRPPSLRGRGQVPIPGTDCLASLGGPMSILPRIATLLLLAVPLLAGAATPPRRVFIAADSTAAGYGPERAPRNGWGQHLQGFLDPGAFEVRNHAIGGRSSRSFIAEGRLDAIARELRRGDVLLVQFGHNDAKQEDPGRYTEPREEYPRWLMRYV